MLVSGAAIVLAAANSLAANGPTIDGKPCPTASQLSRIARLREAVPAVKRIVHLAGRRGVVRKLTRGNQSEYAPSARRVCGAAVVKLSVYVDVHPHGQVCSACDVHAFVVRYRAGRYRVWEAY